MQIVKTRIKQEDQFKEYLIILQALPIKTVVIYNIIIK